MLSKYADENKLPVMDQQTFETITNDIGKEKFREDLAQYIADNRPKFPLKEISFESMRQAFKSLQKQDVWENVKPIEQIEKNVKEKYDDYKYNFKDHGLGIIDSPSIYNDVSNYFHQHLRLNCSSYSFKSPLDVWYNGTAKDIWRCLGPMWRGINGMKPITVDGKTELRGGRLDDKSYVSAFRLQTYIATQFKPNVAKTIYQMTNAKRVLDTSCGWGDRLAGFFASDAEEYYGCDPNPNTYQRYQEQIATYNKLIGKPKKVQIWNCGAEDLPYHKLPKIDVAFTSPPYFSTEQYNKGGIHEKDQSWHKFNEYEKWRDEFYLPVARESLKVSKFMFVNIMDPKIKNQRYRSSDELVDAFKDKFMGQIGMRIMQRPQGNAKFKTKEELNQFMAMKYIENIWCFGPKEDLFKNSRVATLDAFL